MSIKEDLLNQAGYRYNFDRMAYVNRAAKKVFSIEAIEDHSEEWLSEKLAERNHSDWRFYFNEAPSSSVRRDFIAELDERHAVR